MRYLMLIALLANVLSPVDAHTLTLDWYKATDWSLTDHAIDYFKRVFGNDIEDVIETGTFLGETTARLARRFKRVYTFELYKPLFDRAKKRFQHNPNVFIFNEDSGTGLKNVLMAIRGKPLIWLDSHTSGPGTAMGASATPLLQELDGIRASGKKTAVILIDDLRGCLPMNQRPANAVQWPSLAQVYEKVMAINPNYTFLILGDIGLAYDKTVEDVQPSAIVKACTISRLFNDDHIDFAASSGVINAETMLGTAQGVEAEAIKKLAVVFMGSDTEDPLYMMWYGLLLAGQNNHAQAYHYLSRSLNSPRGIKHWRLKWYLAKAARNIGEKEKAHKLVQEVLATVPDFPLAADLLKVLS